MFTVQMLGTKDKVDFTMYLAHTIVSQNKRVLVVDSTRDSRYMIGLARLEDANEFIYEVQGVELISASNEAELLKRLKSEGEKISNYDVVFCDIDSSAAVKEKWPIANTTLYLSDHDRFHMRQDVMLLNRFLDENGDVPIRRFHFSSQFDLPLDHFELLMKNRIEFTADSIELEFDEQLEKLAIMMQHNQIIPFHKLDRDYKQVLTEFVSEMFGLNYKDVNKSAKPSIFGKYKNTIAAEHAN